MNTQVGENVVTLPGRDVPVRVWGAEGLPPLVLLHGLFGNASEWDTVAELLSVGRRVIVPDQRGHGLATWGADYTAERLVGDVIDLVDQLELVEFDLAGHSMGGIVALLYAASHPERVRTLTIIDIGPETIGDVEARSGFLQMLSELSTTTYENVDEAVTRWRAADPLARPVETERWARRSLAREDRGRWGWRADTRRIGQFLSSGPTPAQLWAAADAVSAPALLIYGESSWAMDEDRANALAARLGECRVAEIPGRGHDLGVQAPDAVADQMEAFLGSSVAGLTAPAAAWPPS